MNKKLLAAAVAAAVVAAPAAFADSTIYGKFHVSVDSVDDDSTDVDSYFANSRSSRLGFKGSEDLGNGLKAIFQFETTVLVDGGNDQSVGTGFGSQRNTFIGLAGDFGTFLVGRHDTPAKIAFYATGTENLGDSILDLNPGSLNPIGVFSEFRANNAIAYVSPNFGGFTVAAAIIPGEQSGEKSSSRTVCTPTSPTANTCVTDPGKANDNDGIADHYSLGAMYSGNGLKVGLGYESKTQLDNAVGDSDAEWDYWQLGASYTMNNFTIGANYEDSSDYDFDKGTDYTAYAITGRAQFGNNAINLVYTNSSKDPDDEKKTETDGWGIGADHAFSKRTTAYIAYASNNTKDKEKDTDDDDNVFSLGMIHNF